MRDCCTKSCGSIVNTSGARLNARQKLCDRDVRRVRRNHALQLCYRKFVVNAARFDSLSKKLAVLCVLWVERDCAADCCESFFGASRLEQAFAEPCCCGIGRKLTVRQVLK